MCVGGGDGTGCSGLTLVSSLILAAFVAVLGHMARDLDIPCDGARGNSVCRKMGHLPGRKFPSWPSISNILVILLVTCYFPSCIRANWIMESSKILASLNELPGLFIEVTVTHSLSGAV